MCPKDWQTAERILIACSCDQTMAAEQLDPALQVLRRSLPAVSLLLLTCETTGYKLKSLGQIHPFSISIASPIQAIEAIGDRAFDAAVIFTASGQSPYSLAYLCYLAGIPIRVGQSLEFGGKTLSTEVKPPLDPVSLVEYHLHLLQVIGFVVKDHPSLVSPF